MMDSQFVIACDLGTGGCKSSLYDINGACLDGLFKEYPTYYPGEGLHEQKPREWWDAVKASIIGLLSDKGNDIRQNIVGIGLSGHSLGMVPLDKSGRLLLENVPIWSDTRPGPDEIDPFFQNVPEDEWYMMTGNGFPPALYTVFKILWFRNHHPELFENTHKIIGTKDYINYLLTGCISTDYSYASGTGIYNLKKWAYSDRLIQAAGLDSELFPEIVGSSDILGTLTREVAEELGLQESVKVVAGGVDNSCMALGAKCYKSGRIYNSLGSSSWIAVSSETPVLDLENRPFIFTHVVPGLFTSATPLFSAGSSYKWFASILADKNGNADYKQLDIDAGDIQPGSDKLLFNPSLAGGSSLEKSVNIRGAFLGLTLSHTRAHLTRSVMEGVAFGLRNSLDVLRKLVDTESEITLVGGGSKSSIWRQILSDIYNMKIVKTNVDEQAAALGAAALVFVGCGIWKDFSQIDNLHITDSTAEPNPDLQELYKKLLDLYKDASNYLSDFGDRIREI